MGNNNDYTEIDTNNISLKDKIKKGSNFSWSKVIIAALAAVTVAVISSQLNSALNSVLLVALLSIISALVNEAYRIFAIVASTGAKKVADPLLHTIVPHHKDDETKNSVETTKIDVNTKTTQTIYDNDSIESITQNTPIHTDPIKENKEKTKLEKVKSFLSERPGLLIIIISTIVAMIALAVSYSVTSHLRSENIFNINNPTQELSETEKNELISQAVDEAVLEALEKVSENDETKETEENKSQINSNYDTIELALDDLQSKLKELTAIVEEFELSNNKYVEDNEVIKKELESLIKRIEELENIEPSSFTDSIE